VAEHVDRSSQRLGAAPDRAVAIMRSQLLRARSLARRAVERPAVEPTVDVEARIRHLETALDEAYGRIEVLEVLASEALAALDHQATRLASLDGDLRRARSRAG
jgi:hypothetical protein